MRVVLDLQATSSDLSADVWNHCGGWHIVVTRRFDSFVGPIKVATIKDAFRMAIQRRKDERARGLVHINIIGTQSHVQRRQLVKRET